MENKGKYVSTNKELGLEKLKIIFKTSIFDS